MRFLVKAAKIFGVWVLIFTAFFGIGEICFRLFGNERNSLADIVQKQEGVLFAPSQTIFSESSKPGEFSYTAHINRYGYRGADFQMPKPAGLIRIFAVGDSFTFGVGQEDDQTIPALVQQQLRAQNIPAEVINAGVGHTSPITHLVNIRDIHLQYKPDVVLLFFDMTDLWDDWQFERQAILNQQGDIVKFDPLSVNGRRNWWISCMYHSAFCRYIDRKLVRTYQKIHALGFKEYMKAQFEGRRAKAAIATSSQQRTQQLAIEYDGMLMMRGRERADLIMQHWARTEKYLIKIKELLDKNNIPMVIVMYPHGIYVGKDQWAQGRVTWGFKPDTLYTDRFPFELVESFARQHAITYINTLDDFLKAPVDKYFFNWDGHMTPAGARIVAGAIVKNPGFSDVLAGIEKTALSSGSAR